MCFKIRMLCGTSKVFSTPFNSITRTILLCLLGFFTLNLRAIAAESPTKVVKILAFGDSITAGYKLPSTVAYPFQLEKILKAKNYNAQVINAGISGDTSLQGLQRVDWVMKHHPKVDIVLLELGANDGLRGLSIPSMEENLTKLIEKFKNLGVKEIVLFGMKTTRNFAPEYQKQFEGAFPKIAKRQGIRYLPFFLERIAFHPDMTLEDLIHPNELGHQQLANEIFRFLEKSATLN